MYILLRLISSWVWTEWVHEWQGVSICFRVAYYHTQVFSVKFSWLFCFFFCECIYYHILVIILQRACNRQNQGCDATGKTGNLKVHFSRQGKHREFAKNMFYTGNLPSTQGKFESYKKGWLGRRKGWLLEWCGPIIEHDKNIRKY